MSMPQLRTSYDAVIVGSGHNGLIAAAYLAAAGQSVLVLERQATAGGATTSQRIFPDYDARISRYSYLVSLLSPQIINELQLPFRTRRRATASFTAWKDTSGAHRGLVMSNVDSERTRGSLRELTGSDEGWNDYQRLMQLQSAIARIVWPSYLQPLCHRSDFENRLSAAEEKAAWHAFVERPIGETLEQLIHHDVLRGLLMTDAKIGVFTHPHEPSLLQNRCFLYHVTGQGTGEWQVPVGGMGSLVSALLERCSAAGVTVLLNAPVTAVHHGHSVHTVEFQHEDRTVQTDAVRVLINAGPQTFSRLLGEGWNPASEDEGSVIKMNMLLRRLPRLRAAGISSEEAFTGSFHLNEGYDQMLSSWRQAAEGNVPDVPPAEIYCHTLTDRSILSADLQAQGFQTLTLFGLDMPHRVFRQDHDARLDLVLQRYLSVLDEVCAEPFLDCVARDRLGRPCLEIHSPQQLEAELDLDLGNIFHRAPSWFFTDDPALAGKWGVETQYPRVYRAGSSALRGGAVSGIPGRNAAMCILEELRDTRRSSEFV